MEGKKIFDYEEAGKKDKKNESNIQDALAKVLQVLIGVIMALLHM
ncbi:hypothetical protein [Chryseobacterium sp. KMC2]|nr:hypothetical protein [Chryseobacterium sp. KMC2]